MHENYFLFRKQLEEGINGLGRELSGPMSGFARLHRKGVEDGALSRKTKEMMAVAISIVQGCEGCIAYHTHNAIQAWSAGMYIYAYNCVAEGRAPFLIYPG